LGLRTDVLTFLSTLQRKLYPKSCLRNSDQSRVASELSERGDRDTLGVTTARTRSTELDPASLLS
jgi:hypothetical protein